MKKKPHIKLMSAVRIVDVLLIILFSLISLSLTAQAGSALQGRSDWEIAVTVDMPSAYFAAPLLHNKPPCGVFSCMQAY